MNERLTDLAIKAKVEHCISHVRLQEFAELIVRECAGIACEHMELNEGIDYNIGSKIKQHFGVEE